MTFRNMRFPTGIRYGAASGPEFKTSIARLMAGKTKRNQDRTYPLRTFQVERALRTNALRDAFIDFFMNVNGAADTFRIKDFNDYTVTAAQGVFTSLGANQYQMWKRYTSNGYTKDIPVYLPLTGTISINGGALIETTHWTTSYTVASGIITLVGSPTPSTPTTWSGQYDVHARFESDKLPVNIDDEELYSVQSITVTEERNID